MGLPFGEKKVAPGIGGNFQGEFFVGVYTNKQWTSTTIPILSHSPAHHKQTMNQRNNSTTVSFACASQTNN